MSRVLYEHLAMISTIPVDERQKKPVGALVLATQAVRTSVL